MHKKKLTSKTISKALRLKDITKQAMPLILTIKTVKLMCFVSKKCAVSRLTSCSVTLASWKSGCKKVLNNGSQTWLRNANANKINLTLTWARLRNLTGTLKRNLMKQISKCTRALKSLKLLFVRKVFQPKLTRRLLQQPLPLHLLKVILGRLQILTHKMGWALLLRK